ncbi:polymer-forming cytoskeletal protein [Microbacterium esteraromaticum]|uniref:polymer-forming cytoskeletal protein n=1 Tax=Microbacterium esteraromaticum TaxID=57043 RepID=UPI001956B761|nr:polymer-forming cytoskeletal protein [Microbacterium esteraromaticum]MBM7465805.1 hypothetical protein [Microbacterium esteraromaticum]
MLVAVVVVVMLLGFLVASTIAASVVFTVQANTANRSSTQAFISAESGRDTAYALLTAGVSADRKSFTCDTTSWNSTNASPVQFQYSIYWTPSDVAPSSHEDSGLSQTCPPVSEKLGYFVINSIGTDAQGARAEIDSIYRWEHAEKMYAGGVLAYFAGGVTSTVSNYTGDLVVRSGDYTCANEGTINGDLYVTNGSVNLSRDCTVNGSIWAHENVNGASQLVKVTGEVRAAGNITFTSNGSVLGKAPPTPVGSGNLLAGGSIDLTNTGATDGRVYGNVSATGSINVGSKWVVSGSQTTAAPSPVFDPTLAFIKSVTSWIDLDETSSWNVAPVSACTKTSAEIISLLSTGPTTPIALDYRGCSSVSTDITLTGPSSVALNKDVVFLAPAGKRMNLTLNTGLTGGKQLVFLHADANRALTDGETSPTCGNGSQKDTIDIASGANVSGAKIMIYTPCGLTGNVRASFTGQLYSNDTGSVMFGNGASYTCATMSWPDAFKKLGCKVRGESDDAVIVTQMEYSLSDRTRQVER